MIAETFQSPMLMKRTPLLFTSNNKTDVSIHKQGDVTC